MNGTKKIRIYLSIIAISFVQGMQFVVSPVLGDIQAHYPEMDVSLVQMLITAPSLLSMAVALFSGWLALHISKKRLLVFAAGLAGTVGFLPYLADSFWLLLISRTVYGVSLGIAATMNVAVVAEFFEGQDRVRAMGVQSAGIGAGMVVVTTAAGFLGKNGFRASYPVNVIGFLCMAVLLVCLPETGCQSARGREKLRLGGRVFGIDFLTLLEICFITTFSTNIAMHLRGALAGSTSVSGLLSACFSAAQMLIGLALGALTRVTKKCTISTAFLCFTAGGALLVLFPSSAPMLAVAALFCGFSQGIFIPSASTEIANAVPPAATALASATFTCAMNVGQLLSPVLLNPLSGAVFGAVSTSNVYLIAAVGAALSAAGAFLWLRRSNPGNQIEKEI